MHLCYLKPNCDMGSAEKQHLKISTFQTIMAKTYWHKPDICHPYDVNGESVQMRCSSWPLPPKQCCQRLVNYGALYGISMKDAHAYVVMPNVVSTITNTVSGEGAQTKAAKSTLHMMALTCSMKWSYSHAWANSFRHDCLNFEKKPATWEERTEKISPKYILGKGYKEWL